MGGVQVLLLLATGCGGREFHELLLAVGEVVRTFLTEFGVTRCCHAEFGDELVHALLL